MELLIAALPAKDDSGERVSPRFRCLPFLTRSECAECRPKQAKRLEELQAEMGIASTEYKEALAQAGMPTQRNRRRS